MNIRLVLSGLLVCVGSLVAGAQRPRPNILWITSEDNGPQLGCYGDAYANTPNLDALATKSLRYDMCWSNAPVCAPARTTLISGMYANSLGGHHMRSGITVPANIVMYPKLFRDAGYYTTNNNKTDYNFHPDGLTNDTVGWNDSGRKAHWRNRPDPSMPFFHIYNSTISHESKIRVRPHTLVHDPADAPVPSYHPDTPEVRHDWAQYYDKMTAMDGEMGKVLAELEADGLADSTIIFYYGDHGSGMPRSKRWPFNSGLQVPLLIHVPQAYRDLAPQDYQPGEATGRLAAFVDMAPTALSMAGIRPPANMQGIPLAGEFEGKAKEFVFGFRGRMDERIDNVRSCTDGRFVYLRHFYPDRPYLKYVGYMFQTPTTRIWKEMFDRGELNAIQSQVWQTKPHEELFDLQSDPDEVHNLASMPEHAERLARMRGAVRDWMVDITDLGILPEHDMHTLSAGQSPRQWGLDHRNEISKLIDAAFESFEPSTSIETLADGLKSKDPLHRYYAARGIAAKTEKSTAAFETLASAMDDESITVSIAAADGLLDSPDADQRNLAIARLIELGDANRTSQYAALLALNALDMNASLTPSQMALVGQLPKSAEPAPKRAEKYVVQILDHLLSTAP